MKPDLDSPRSDIVAFMRQLVEAQDIITPGSLNIDTILREMVSSSLKNTTRSRLEVAAEMSKLIDEKITKTTLDTYSAESKKGHRLPAAYLVAFSHAVQDKSILRFICMKAGGLFVEGEDALLLQLGKIEEQKRELLNREKTIRDLIHSLRGSGDGQG